MSMVVLLNVFEVEELTQKNSHCFLFNKPRSLNGLGGIASGGFSVENLEDKYAPTFIVAPCVGSWDIDCSTHATSAFSSSVFCISDMVRTMNCMVSFLIRGLGHRREVRSLKTISSRPTTSGSLPCWRDLEGSEEVEPCLWRKTPWRVWRCRAPANHIWFAQERQPLRWEAKMEDIVVDKELTS
jgi:hypothetical protein